MEETVQTTETISRKEKVKQIVQDSLLEAGLYACIFLLTFVLFLGIKPLVGIQGKGVIARALMLVAIGGIITFIAYIGATKRLKSAHIVIALLAIGYALRLGYMLAAPATDRQHDVFTKNFDGHEAYAWTIFETGALPTTNRYQMYHPPLNAMVQAWFMRFMNGVVNTLGIGSFVEEYFTYGKPAYLDTTRYFLYSSCQILSVTYSFIISVLSLKILRIFGFSGKTYLLLAAFAVLYPRNIQFAGMLNNDALSYLFAMLALFFALRWWKGKKSIVYILLCAFSIGFGMMSKLSSATVCAPIAGIFIYEFIQTLRKKEGALPFWKMAVQYLLFLCICAPIGLWFQVYAQEKFGQSFGYVFSNLNHKLYTGDRSFFSRFFIAFDFSEYFGSVFCRPFDNYNLFHYALRCSIFGEFQYAQGHGFGVLAILFLYALVILFLIGLVWSIVNLVKNKGREKTISLPDLLFIALLVLSQILSEISFYIKMPYGCTMDFRYIMPLILGGALSIGFIQKALATSEGTFAKQIHLWIWIVSIGFISSSALFYCTCV